MEGGGVDGCETCSPVGGPQDPLYTESRVQSSGELSAIRLRATRKPDAGSQLSLASPHAILGTQQVLSEV